MKSIRCAPFCPKIPVKEKRNMADFTLRFFLCNGLICLLIGLFALARFLLKNSLTSRMRYHMWFWLLGLLTVPFWPFRAGWKMPHPSWFDGVSKVSAAAGVVMGGNTASGPVSAGWMNDIGISVSRNAPSAVGRILCLIWMAGMFVMTCSVIKALLRFRSLRKSSLPLQNPAVYELYLACLAKLKIRRRIPVRSTAFLRSPVIAGFLRPCVYLPIHLISDCREKDIRYMLLHELQHYKHKDALANYAMNIAGIVYWFNPFVWYALREMKNDREMACDTSVLRILPETAYKEYGNTLLNFTEKISLTPYPFATGISGSMKQMKKRILNIADYRPASFREKMRGAFACAVIALLLSGAVPSLAVRDYNNDCYYFSEKENNIVWMDLSETFDGYDGCFVLYDDEAETWRIYGRDAAVTRIPPASTFKIFSALFALESGVITPEQSLIPWDGQNRRYEHWNEDQTLFSAMQDSVTWYFQALDARTGMSETEAYIRETGYGNQTVGKDVSSYWMDDTLRISPVEQIEMLRKLYDNRFGFSPENVEAVKKSICLYDSGKTALYGKTGTQEADGRNISGWFVGYLEKDGRTFFFAANIRSEEKDAAAAQASGPAAAELTFSILSDLGL